MNKKEEKIKELENNWNKLKEWLEYETSKTYCNSQFSLVKLGYKNTLDKMDVIEYGFEDELIVEEDNE